MNEEKTESGQVIPRKRSLTSLTLQWISERLRRSEEIKQQVKSGSYSVSSQQVAQSLVREDE